ncbi:HNH endonuclease [Phytohabitans aurantiacus]|uniref:HNH nuclease domain-containing protein n=1 Tax=Phytohabitans aurantiacus TaxID=3016789 RepID=A0ABQ5QK36_9ACTN|nr:hypothetical protein [Phytohabitans aurantiacus]GLH94916.1 hypothetical protein Pa4123_01880 [Phytohabitans aurantiacus]
MTWLKSSDTAGNHPVVLSPLAWPAQDGDVFREDLANLLFGFVNRCALHSAQYDTDYVISDATVSFVAGQNWQLRAEQARRAGYWTRVDGGGWLLIDDSEHLFNIRLRAEKEWERTRKRDNGNPALTIPVRLRDGDGCRYCGRVVDWKARRGSRAGTYDHVYPGKAARGPDDLRVCCGGCNSARGDNPDAFAALPAPATPFYGELTVALLAEHGITVPMSTPPRPGTVPDHATPAPGDPAPSGTTRPALPAPPTRPASPADTAPSKPTATRQPAEHRARNTAATRQPGGHRAQHPRDRATSPTPPAAPGDPAAGRTTLAPSQDQQRSPGGEPAGAGRNRQIGSLPDLTGSGRDRDGSGGPALSPPTTNRNRRRRGRRGRAHRPTQEDP